MASSARIDELRKKFDENPRRYFAPLANEYRKAGDLDQAIFICQEYLPQQPGHMSGHIVYGQALFEQNRHEEARTVFETALSLDPENLIALRHLGDIARLSGDAGNARIWYQRVLEADPRNEEIAQLMLSLLTPANGSVPHAAPAAPPAVDHAAPTPLTNPAVPAAPQASPEAHAVGAAGDLGVEKAQDLTLGGSPAAVPDPAEIVPAPRPATEPPRLQADPREYVSRHAPKEDELLDLDGFDLGGVPLSTLRESASAAPGGDPHGAAAGEPQGSMPALESSAPDVSGDDAFSEGLDLEGLDGSTQDASPFAEPATVESSSSIEIDAPFEADPFAIAATPASERTPLEAAPTVGTSDNGEETSEPPTIELAGDVSLGLPDDGISASFVEGGEVLDGLESFEAGILPNAPRDTIAIDTGSFYDIPAAEPEASVPAPTEAEQGDQADRADEPEAAVAEPAAAFVTETMATLYLQQGHLDSALEIYRRLVEQRPDDAGLRERMATVESELASARRAEAEPAAVAEPALEAQSYGGPTIREFLSGLMTRRPVVDDAGPPEPPAVAESAPLEAEPMEPAVPEPEEEPVVSRSSSPATGGTVVRPTPSSGETVGGSLDMLFSGADAAANDAEAARALADAFASDSPETAPLQGVPAHRASSELSLNHVFKGSTPQRTSAEVDAFSFDQFFTENAAAAEPADAESSSTTPAEGADDIAQFNAWLNGLKKT